MIGYSISSWGIFCEEDNDEGSNVLVMAHHLEKFDDALSMNISWGPISWIYVPPRLSVRVARKSAAARLY